MLALIAPGHVFNLQLLRAKPETIARLFISISSVVSILSHEFPKGDSCSVWRKFCASPIELRSCVIGNAFFRLSSRNSVQEHQWPLVQLRHSRSAATELVIITIEPRLNIFDYSHVDFRSKCSWYHLRLADCQADAAMIWLRQSRKSHVRCFTLAHTVILRNVR